MVERLVGQVNGQEVTFNKVGGDIWEVIVPGSLDGIYIVQMTAYDDAGNVSSMADYLLLYDPKNICIRLEPCPYELSVDTDPYHFELMKDEYRIEIETAVCGCNAR